MAFIYVSLLKDTQKKVTLDLVCRTGRLGRCWWRSD